MMTIGGVEVDRIKSEQHHFADIIRASATTSKSRFVSDSAHSFQFGLLAHEAGFTEPAHTHKSVPRVIHDLQQMFVVQRGVIRLDFFNDDGSIFDSAIVGVGDAVVLIAGTHSLTVLEDMQCVSVKQGPFLGDENDKVLVEVTK